MNGVDAVTVLRHRQQNRHENDQRCEGVKDDTDEDEQQKHEDEKHGRVFRESLHDRGDLVRNLVVYEDETENIRGDDQKEHER